MKTLMLAAAAALTLSFAGVANSAELLNGVHYGTGNDYTPGNWTVATGGGIETGLRAHEVFQVAPAPSGNLYTFALGQTIGFDFSIDPTFGGTPVDLTSALITITNLGTGGVASFNPLLLPDNSIAGSIQNSERLSFGFLNGSPIFNVGDIDYNNAVNSSYRINLTVAGGGIRSLQNEILVQQGTGAVPEPATWAMMILGFGMAGATLRRRHPVAVSART